MESAVTIASSPAPLQGSDCRDAFRAAYENRYTWDPGFPGYQGRCVWQQGDQTVEGRFRVGADLKASVEGIDDPDVEKAISSQLWEVAIHRVRRGFEQVHGENTFTAGGTDPEGLEVIVGGKNAGDRYRISDRVVTMVHRHIHGTVVTIHTGSTTETGSGYLSRTYTSRYADPTSGEPRGGLSHFTDTFTPLQSKGPWILQERRVVVDGHGETPASEQLFRFLDCEPLPAA